MAILDEAKEEGSDKNFVRFKLTGSDLQDTTFIAVPNGKDSHGGDVYLATVPVPVAAEEAGRLVRAAFRRDELVMAVSNSRDIRAAAAGNEAPGVSGNLSTSVYVTTDPTPSKYSPVLYHLHRDRSSDDFVMVRGHHGVGPVNLVFKHPYV